MAKLRIPYGLPVTRHRNQSLDSADCNIEASPKSRCLCDSLHEIDQVSICRAKAAHGREGDWCDFVFVFVFMRDMHFGQGEYEYPRPLQSR